VVARLAHDAEEAGWDGFFVWDHVHWREPVREIADPWITLAAITIATETVRLGPLVTPLARRRPVQVAKQAATLDHLRHGRLTLGAGLGSDRFGREFALTGEEVDERRRGQMLDEALEILTVAWSGEPVNHRGEHYTVDGMRFLPRPVQQPGVPIWIAGTYGKPKPLRRAARHDGFFPINLEHPDQLAQIVADLNAVRAESGAGGERFDVIAAVPPDRDPEPFAHAGASWALVEIPWERPSIEEVQHIIRTGPVPVR
jgi:alkanesulfonate monooxygenase SsuD/methylene tetrahydromethanopterin reductase-like flavin-dependent oxidoreductase (luciferase family)